MYFESMKMRSMQVAVLVIFLGAVVLISQRVHAAISDTLTYTWKTGSTYLRDHWNILLAKGLTGSYVSAMPIGAEWWGFSTEWPRDPVSPGVCPGTKCPGLIRFVGPSPTDFSISKRIVLPNEAITDVFEWNSITKTYSTTTLAAKRMFTRPTIFKVQKSGGGGDFWGFIYVTNSYPPLDGRVFPATIRSKDGINWEYLGKVKGDLAAMFPDGAPYWGSGHSLEVRAGTVPLNMSVPAANKFFTLIDGTRLGVRLAALFSADGTTWYLGRNPNGTIQELLPVDVAGHMIGPVFPSLRRVGTAGYLAAVPDGWYSTGAAVRNAALIHSCDGKVWQSLGDPARQDPTFIGQKTTNLAYFDKATRTLYLYASWGAGFDTANFFEVLNKIIVPATIPCPPGTTVTK
ncbi:MAG: hypothetical protein WAS21_26115 [Geminicoccaceae bacterium]